MVQRYNKYLKSYSISAIFFVFILRNDGRWKKADGRRLMADGRWKKEEGRGQKAEGRGKKLSTRRIFYGYVYPQILVHVPVIFFYT